MAEIKFVIEKEIGVLAESQTGWKRKLALVSWNDKPAKYDIRDWSPDGSKMGRGITLSKEELKVLTELIKQENLD